jgi:hypothetical protein
MGDEAEKGGEAQPGDGLQPAPAPDAYQASYMGEGALYYDKIRAPLAFHLIFLLPLLGALGAGIAAASVGATGAIVASLAPILILLVAWILFSVLRVSVTRDEVFIQYGLVGPRIPVRDIERCAAVSYDWKRYGGWGIRYGRDGSVAYNMMGDQGRAVEIVYRKGDKEAKVLVASPDPVRLAAAVNHARAQVAAGPARIAASAPAEEKDDVMREAEAEAEAIAAEAEAEAKRQA